MVKIYWTLWTIIAILAVLLFVTGNFTMLTLVAFGFVSFGMIFMGMISVLPSTVGHHAPPKKPRVRTEVKPEKAQDERIFQPNTLATR